jgi:hypothetical protein
MRAPFCILNMLGDILDHGELVFVEAAQTLGAAKRRVVELSDLIPGQYVIYNQHTGERFLIVASPKANCSVGKNSASI